MIFCPSDNLSSDIRFDPYSVELTNERKWELIDNFAREVMDRGLDTEAIFTLEFTKPISWIGIQFVMAISPIFVPLINNQKFYEYFKLFQDRGNAEVLIQRIEQLRDKKDSTENKDKILTFLKQKYSEIRYKRITKS